MSTFDGLSQPKSEQHTSINRREEILEAAVSVFATNGYYKTTTAQVAAVAGISQPYVYRFFDSKEALFVAALEQALTGILAAFDSVHSPAETLIQDMCDAYMNLIATHHNEIVLQVQAQVVPDEAVRKVMRTYMTRISNYILDRFSNTGVEDPTTAMQTFMAQGMLCNVSAVLDMPELLAVDNFSSTIK